MPRGGSAGGRGYSARMSNAPKPVSHAPPPAPAQESGIVNGVAYAISNTIEGFFWGGGNAIAQRVADFWRPRTFRVETVAAENTGPGSDACMTHSKAFTDCLHKNGSDISKCQFYFNMIKECRCGATLKA